MTVTSAVTKQPHNIKIPRNYNAATDFVDRHLDQGRAEKIAFIDDDGSYTYGELAQRVNRFGNVLKDLGIRQEARVALCLLDTIDFPTAFWGCIKVGAVPIALNTLLTSRNYEYLVADSRAQVLVVSEALYKQFASILDKLPSIEHVIVSGSSGQGHSLLTEQLATASSQLEPARTTRDDVAFWLCSSGSTGNPKGVKHLHSNLVYTGALYGQGVLGIREDDVVFSAAKLFFAYGLGNGMTFPMSVGATTVLMAERPTPDAVMGVLKQHQPSIYYGVPTLYAAILADPDHVRSKGSERLRRCVSAGEALPEDVGRRWEDRFEVEILDGVGSTEMLHIFLSNSPGKVRYGVSGKPVPGYEARLVDEQGNEIAEGEIGELLISGPSAAEGYWNQREKSLDTFVGRWTCTGDKYFLDAQGDYHYCGRTDDMFKSGGNWVSPFEVESALISHDKVLEVGVISHADASGNLKPKAYVVLKPGVESTHQLKDEIQQYVKSDIEAWKYPRWIEFLDSLPKTATGKVQRFKLREMDRS